MAVTGSGTQADPWVVHSYEEFISKSGTYPSGETSAYIKFEVPGSVIDCNTYGSEFKWNTFEASVPDRSDYYVDIDLNGTTIKNFIINENVPMFKSNYQSWSSGGAYYSTYAHLTIHDGSIRNAFLGSSTSRIAVSDRGELKINNVSFSINSTTATTEIFNGITLDNCALYIKQATLVSGLMQGCTVTDTDFELHIDNQNAQNMFPSCSFIDCRVQGKVSGNTPYYSDSSVIHHTVLGAITRYYDGTPITNWVNCVIDLDLTESTTQRQDGVYHIIWAYSGGINTNVMCKSHFPAWSVPSDWNYMTHEQIRDATYLNSKGFVVVDVSGS